MSSKQICYSILFPLCFFVVIFSCKNNNRYNTRNEDEISLVKDSITVFLEIANDENFTDQERGNNAIKAYLLTLELDDSLKGRNYINIANRFSKINDFNKYKEFNHKALKVANKINDSIVLARAFFNLGNYYLNSNYRSDSAYYYFNRAERAYITLKDTLRIGISIRNMGIIQSLENDFLGSEASIIRSIPYFELVDNDRSLATAYSSLGSISNELGQFSDAIKYHNQALDYRKQLNNKLFEVYSLNDIGLTYEKQKMYLEALDYFNQAMNYDNLLVENPGLYSVVSDNLAHASFKLGNTTNLPKMYFDALKLSDSLNDIPAVINIKKHLAEYYQENDSIELAKKYAYEANELAKKAKISSEVLNTLLLLSQLEDKEKGLELSQQYISFNDSLQKRERAIRNQFARIRFDTDKIASENEKITREKELLVFVIAILFTLGLLLYIIIKQMSQNKELMFQQQQQQANEEIYNLMLSQQVKLEEGRQLEKQRISRELHDGVLGGLFGTRLSLESLVMQEKDISDNTEEKTRHIRELKKIEQEIRNISHDLSNELFSSDIGYVEVVEKLIKTQTDVTGLEFEFNNNADIKWERVSSQVKIHLYRIIQESLQNINKHAKAKKVKVSLLESDKKIHLVIADDGVGFKLDKSKNGIGLTNIESRVNEISGKLNISSERNKGTKLTITVPL